MELIRYTTRPWENVVPRPLEPDVLGVGLDHVPLKWMFLWWVPC